MAPDTPNVFWQKFLLVFQAEFDDSDLSDRDVDVINPAKGPESKARLHDKIPKKKSRRQKKTEAVEVENIEAKKSSRRIFNKPSLRDDLRSAVEATHMFTDRRPAKTDESSSSHKSNPNLKSEIEEKSEYLPTPRAEGGIWSSKELPPRKVLLREMVEDTKFLLEWIKCGVPNIIITNEIKSLTTDITKARFP